MAEFFISDALEFSDRFLRSENQDRSFTICFSEAATGGKRLWLGGVLDGVSQGNGRAASELAASAAIHEAWKQLPILLDATLESEYARNVAANQLLRRILLEADYAVKAWGGGYTTMSLGLLYGEDVYTANVGDSPIYLLRWDSPEHMELRPMFLCCNEAGEMVAEEKLTEQEALTSRYKNGLLKALGDGLSENDAVTFRKGIATFHEVLMQNNILLLGSDGALATLLQEELLGIVQTMVEMQKPLTELRRRLMEQAEQAGSTDNFTLNAVRVGVI